MTDCRTYINKPDDDYCLASNSYLLDRVMCIVRCFIDVSVDRIKQELEQVNGFSRYCDYDVIDKELKFIRQADELTDVISDVDNGNTDINIITERSQFIRDDIGSADKFKEVLNDMFSGCEDSMGCVDDIVSIFYG